MAKILQLTTLALAAFCLSASLEGVRGEFDNGNKFVCYWGTWSVYRQGNGKFDITHVDPHLCTHLVYGFAGLRNNEIASLDPYLDLPENWGKGNFVLFNNLKQQNPKLKTILAIGGWNEGSVKYSQMAASASARATFVASVVTMLEKYGFDGLDMDWEYPTERGGAEEDYNNFISLLSELKAALAPRGLLLTAAVSAGKPTVEHGYNVKEMNKHLDIISLMAYDYFGAWNDYTQHNAPLLTHPQAEGNYTWFNVRDSVELWISMGATPSKMVLGMPLYGRGYRLDDENDATLYAPASNPCEAGEFTREAGFLGYYEICSMNLDSSSGFTRYWEKTIQAPYATFTKSSWAGKQWVSFDDVESLGLKMDIIDEFGLGGGMVWSIETDDFRNVCGKGTNPLLKYISARLNDGVIVTDPPAPDTTAAPEVTTKPAGTTSDTGGSQPTSAPGNCKSNDFVCPSVGNHDLGDCCVAFCKCSYAADLSLKCEEMSCSPGTVYNPSFGGCDWTYNVPGCS